MRNNYSIHKKIKIKINFIGGLHPEKMSYQFPNILKHFQTIFKSFSIL